VVVVGNFVGLGEGISEGLVDGVGVVGKSDGEAVGNVEGI